MGFRGTICESHLFLLESSTIFAVTISLEDSNPCSLGRNFCLFLGAKAMDLSLDEEEEEEEDENFMRSE